MVGPILDHVGTHRVNPRRMHGHESLEMSAHYVGLEDDQMRAGLGRFDAVMRQATEPAIWSRPHRMPP
jgi:hypothetical protein